MIKNQTGQLISFLMLSATDGSGVNTGTTYVGLMKDGSAPVAATNSPSHKSNGSWTLSLTQAETNCDHLLAVMTISGAITSMTQVYTVDPANFKADVSALATAASITDIKGPTWSTSTDSLELIRDRVDLGINLTAGIVSATDKLDSTLVWTGSGNVYKFTTDALSNGPAGGTATLAKQDEIIADIGALNNFDAASDTVAQVTLVDTVTLNSDMRGTENANTVSPDNSGIVANGNAIAALVDATPQEFWDALTTGSYASSSFGERLLRSTTQQAELAVTGSHHVAADVHEFQPDAINASAIAADAVAEIQAGLAEASELALVPKTGTAYTHTNQAGDTMTVTIS